MELLSVPRPGLSRTVKTSRAQRVEMKGGRPAEKRACPAVPDRHCKGVDLFDRRNDVSVKIHQFETKTLHLPSDEIQGLIEKSAAVCRDRLSSQLLQSFAAVINDLFGTQAQLFDHKLRAGFPPGSGHNFLHPDHLQYLDSGRTESPGTTSDKDRIIWSRFCFEANGLIGGQTRYRNGSGFFERQYSGSGCYKFVGHAGVFCIRSIAARAAEVGPDFIADSQPSDLAPHGFDHPGGVMTKDHRKIAS